MLFFLTVEPISSNSLHSHTQNPKPQSPKTVTTVRRFLEMSMSVSRIKMGEQEEEDRLSSLPDCLISIIFKFMEMSQIVQTSVLSKRWRSQWKSTSYLNFNLHSRSSEKDHVDRVLLLRNHSYNIHTLHLAFVDCQPTKLDTWVTYAMCRNVQEVTVTCVEIHASTVEALCGTVKCLTLRKVSVVFEDDCYELLLSCPIMETLELGVSGCYTIDNLDDEIYCSDIKLSAPNLKVFTFTGCVSMYHALGNLSNLLTVTIDVDVWRDGEDEYLLDYLLGGLPNMESLDLSLNDIPATLKIPITLNKLATLQNLRYLKLATYFFGEPSVYCFSTILKLLEKSPNVETLVLDGRLKWQPEFVEEDLVAGLMSWCKLCHLKTFKIEGVLIDVSACAFKFLECLMENTTSLQSVVMTTATKEKDGLAKLCKKLKVPFKMTSMASDRIGVSLKPSKKVHWETA